MLISINSLNEGDQFTYYGGVWTKVNSTKAVNSSGEIMTLNDQMKVDGYDVLRNNIEGDSITSDSDEGTWYYIPGKDTTDYWDDTVTISTPGVFSIPSDTDADADADETEEKQDVPKELEFFLKNILEETPEKQSLNTNGSKADAHKPKIRKGAVQHFPFAMVALALLSEYGANKYSWENWKQVENMVERYGDAEARHILGEVMNEYDDESGFLHATHEAWCAVAKLDGKLREKYNDLKGDS